MDAVVFILFLSLLVWVGMRKAACVSTEGAYLMANRETGLFALTATLVMTELNTATLISFASMGYLVGKWALWLPAVFLVGLLFYALVVAKKWKAYDGFSVAGYFSERFGSGIGRLASVALLVAMLGFSAAYVKSLQLLFSPFWPGANPWVLSGALVGVVLLMMLRGGLFSIIRTDVFTFVVVVIFFPLMAWLFRGGSGGDFEVGAVALPPRFIVSLVVLTCFTYILAPWYGQKVFSARNERVAYSAVALAAVIVFGLYALAVKTTWGFRSGGGVAPSPEQAFPFALMSTAKGFRGLGFGILFAASATTLSGVWSAMSAMVVGDFFGRRGNESHFRSMALTLGFATLSYLGANVLVDGVFDQLIYANIPVLALSFALLGGFYWSGASRVGAYVSVGAGWAWGIGCKIFFSSDITWYWVIPGIPIIFISGIVASKLFPNRKIVSSRG